MTFNPMKWADEAIEAATVAIAALEKDLDVRPESAIKLAELKLARAQLGFMVAGAQMQAQKARPSVVVPRIIPGNGVQR